MGNPTLAFKAPARVRPRPLLDYFEGEVEPARSRQMSRIRSKDTTPERALRRAVHRLGSRFRVHVADLPGRPDLANKRAKVVVFVDGCFWHGCPAHFVLPRTRRAFWKEKIRRNQERRASVLQGYDAGWTVLQFWECDLLDVAAAAGRVATALSK